MRIRSSAPGIAVIDPDGEVFHVSNKTARWLLDSGYAKKTGPRTLA